MKKVTIQDLKKGNVFKFNDEKFIVTRKWIDEDRPLIAQSESAFKDRHKFWHEGLEVELIS